MGFHGIGRPAKADVKYFQRQLGLAERQTLLVAGDGDLSAGFLEVIDTYRYLYNLGLRRDTPLEKIRLTLPRTKKDKALETP